MNKFAILFGLSFILPSKVIAVTGGGDQGGPAYESWQGLIIKDKNRCSPEAKLQVRSLPRAPFALHFNIF